MNPLLLLRLALDVASLCLLMLAMAYHWQGNRVHEIAGTVMFLLLITHNLFNRHWYGAVATRRRERRGQIDLASTFMLLTMMLVLLGTSVLISETVFGFLSLQGSAVFTARQIHAFAAYWVLLLLAVHLGLRWPLIMLVARNLLRAPPPSRRRSLVLRGMAAGIAAAGVNAWFALGIDGKLMLEPSLDWWNFEESVLGFFLHCLAFTGLGTVLVYYAMKWLKRGQR